MIAIAITNSGSDTHTSIASETRMSRDLFAARQPVDVSSRATVSSATWDVSKRTRAFGDTAMPLSRTCPLQPFRTAGIAPERPDGVEPRQMPRRLRHAGAVSSLRPKSPRRARRIAYSVHEVTRSDRAQNRDPRSSRRDILQPCRARTDPASRCSVIHDGVLARSTHLSREAGPGVRNAYPRYGGQPMPLSDGPERLPERLVANRRGEERGGSGSPGPCGVAMHRDSSFPGA